MSGYPLISIPLLCSFGCKTTITDTTLNILFNNTIILQGIKQPNTGLYLIPLATLQLQHNANHVNTNSNTLQELACFYHAACFSPVKSSWLQAITNGHFATWPQLTPTLIKKHLPPSVASITGHLDQAKRTHTRQQR